MTAAELESGNLLPRPSSVLTSAAGVIWILIFEKSLGPMASDDDVTSWVEQGGKLGVLGIARSGDAVAVAVKPAGGVTRTVQNAVLTLGGAPSFGTADLTIRYVVQGSDPRKLPDYAAAGAQTTQIDDGIVAQGKRALQDLGGTLAAEKDSIVHAVKYVAIVVLIAGAIYLAIQVVGLAKKAA